MIAVADGLGGHIRGEEASEAAVGGLPERIGGTDEMAVAFGEAHERVLALSEARVWRPGVRLEAFPMSTLCVAAWTPEAGLLIGWMGDTLPFIAYAGPDGFRGYCCGRPHRVRGGKISICLGMPPGFGESADRVEVEMVGESGDGTRPDAVILASDGAWEPFVYEHGVEWLADNSTSGGIGSVCGPARLQRRRHRQPDPCSGSPPRPQRQRHHRHRPSALTSPASSAKGRIR